MTGYDGDPHEDFVQVVLFIPARAIAYVEDYDHFQRGVAVGRGRYAFDAADARRLRADFLSWAEAFETESRPSADMRADIRALRKAASR